MRTLCDAAKGVDNMRSKSNLKPAPKYEPPIMESDARRAYLRGLELWRVFDFYFCGLQELKIG